MLRFIPLLDLAARPDGLRTADEFLAWILLLGELLHRLLELGSLSWGMTRHSCLVKKM